jgi:hypothetical protein
MTGTPNDAGSARSTPDGAFTRIGRDLDNLLRNCVPSGEVSQHFTNARLEVLKGLRAMIDARIDRLSSEKQKGVSIPVE